MANNGEARQYSFTMGEISPEKYYTPNEVTYQQGLAKAENVIVKASGGVETRGGTQYESSIGSLVEYRDAAIQEITFQHPITKIAHSLSLQVTSTPAVSYRLFLDDTDITAEILPKNYGSGLNIFDSANNGAIRFDEGRAPKLAFTMSSEYLIITPAVKLYSDVFESLPDTDYFKEDAFGWYTETILALAFSKPFTFASIPNASAKGIRVISNFGGSLYYPQNAFGVTTQVKVEAGGIGTPPDAKSRVTYLITAVRKDGTEEIYMSVRSNDTASSNITEAININCPQTVDGTSTGPLYFPVSGYRTTLKITNIHLRKNLEGVPKYKFFNIYRAVENDPNLSASFSLVTRFPVYKTSADTFTINFTDSGESDPSVTPPMDRTFYIGNPSIAEMDSGIQESVYSPNKIISAAFYQSRLFVALNKSNNFDNEATTSNTIIASKLNAPEQLALPLITNPAEAFSFQVPEESGGYITHLQASARLIALTSKSVFVFMGDESGTLSPLVLNPVKVFSVGAMQSVPPCTFGEYTFFAMEGVSSVGFIRITAQGEISYGDALPISRHIFEERGEIITDMKVLTGPDSSQIRLQVLTDRDRIVEITGTDGVFGVTRNVFGKPSNLNPISFAENFFPMQTVVNGRPPLTGGVFYEALPRIDRIYQLRNIVADNAIKISKLYNPYVDFSLFEGVFDIREGWQITNNQIAGGPNSFLVDQTFNLNLAFTGVTDFSAGTIPVTLTDDTDGTDGQIFSQFNTSDDRRKFAIKFYIIDSTGSEQVITGEISGPDSGTIDVTFADDVPLDFRDKNFKMLCLNPDYSNFKSPQYLSGQTGLAFVAADRLLVPEFGYSRYFRSFGEIQGVPLPILGDEYPIPMLADGEIISDTLESSSPIKAEKVFIDGSYWEIFFNGAYHFCVQFGIPFESNVQTLPLEVAVGQGDSISDAGKLIAAVAVSVYQTDSLKIGEIDQPEDYMTDIDFTTDQSPTAPVKFNGVKEYNFSASWNKHGMVKLKNKPFRSFSISSITPKGNVSV